MNLNLRCPDRGLRQPVIVATQLAIGLLVFLAASAGAAPSISSISPTSGPPGTSVQINGAGFVNVTELRFNQSSAVFTVGSSTRIDSTVPLDATTGPISVISLSGFATSAQTFRVPPIIMGFSPPQGFAGAEIAIHGANFEGATAVRFNGIVATFTLVAPSQINAVVPASAKSGPITVTTPVGEAASVEAFAVGNSPGIAQFHPDRGTPGTLVVIHGVNFLGVTNVNFNGTNATFTIVAPTQINATVPLQATTGLIRVISPDGSATSSQAFIVDDGVPVIRSFSPTTGAVGTAVVIDGDNFQSVASVKFNGTNATFSVTAPTQINATVPAGATPGPIVVTNSFGAATSSVPFVVTGPKPMITAFSPIRGPKGTVVILNGQNFANVRSVMFNGTNATFTINAPTQISATVPATATSGPIIVTNVFGAATSSIPFTVLGDAPVIDDFSPRAGGPGTIVVIDGSNFAEATAVRFNGVTAANFSVNAISQISATVPVGTTTGPISVATPSGTNTSSQLFYLPPVLTGFSPASGIAGQAVTVAGTNLTGAIEVRFNQSIAAFEVVKPTEIRALVPLAATSGTISVATPAGIVATTNAFVVKPLITGFSPLAGPVSTEVLIQGSGLNGATAVTFNGVAASFTVSNSTLIRAVVPASASTGLITVTTPEGSASSTNGFIVTFSSDLSVTQTAFLFPAEPGEAWTNTIVISNTGPSFAIEVLLTNSIPTGLTLLSATSSLGSVTVSNRNLSAKIGVITNATAATVTLRLLSTNSGLFTNIVGVSSAVPDANPFNNQSAARIIVISAAERTLKLEVLPNRQARVSWPTSAVPMILEIIGELPPFETWRTVTNKPVVLSGRNVVTNTLAPDQRFYRLRLP